VKSNAYYYNFKLTLSNFTTSRTDGQSEIICNEVLITCQTAAEMKARNKCQHMANSKQNRNGS